MRIELRVDYDAINPDDDVVLVDKPSGWTSFDVVAKIRSALRARTGRRLKVGHCGTLDPFATGLLIICVGNATKRVESFLKQDKVYEVEMVLGMTSTTGDPEGELLVSSLPQKPSQEEVGAALASFVGDSLQTPPIFSAIKINGRKAYDLARSGKEVKLEPRSVHIYSLQLTKYSFPRVAFNVHVSSGTYIRSLVVDIGARLGGGAYTTALRRTHIGQYSLSKVLSGKS